MRDKFFEVLTNKAKENKNIVLLVADIGFKVIDNFKSVNPKQFFNVGISEQNMASIATGLALSGKKVFCYSIANFTIFRSLEQIRNGACYHNCDVNFISGGSGYSYGSLGYTHHAIEDLAMMRSLPNINVYSPCNNYEIEKITNYICKKSNKPTYIRIDKSKLETDIDYSKIKNLNEPRSIISSKNPNLTILSTGGIINQIKQIIIELREKEIYCNLYSVFNLTNLNHSFQKKLKNQKILIIEETIKENGLYSFINGKLRNNFIETISLNKDSVIYTAGDQNYLRNLSGLSKKNIIKKIKEILKYE